MVRIILPSFARLGPFDFPSAPLGASAKPGWLARARRHHTSKTKIKVNGGGRGRPPYTVKSKSYGGRVEAPSPHKLSPHELSPHERILIAVMPAGRRRYLDVQVLYV
ncbi:MAG: hypothetical protein WA804_20005 [Terriglobales bacterium]